MKKIYFVLMILLIAWLGAFDAVLTNDESQEKKLYNRGQKDILASKWSEALNKFQQLIDDFPSSAYQDDAQFWIGYCLEKKENTQMEAFLTFEKLVNKYPTSSWVDDAIVHQISLAEKFVNAGKEQYLSFLVEKLQEPDPIRQQAAISLGKLGDRRALPILKEIQSDDDLGLLAKNLIEWVESDRKSVFKSQEQSQSAARLEFLRESAEGKGEKSKDEKTNNFLFFPTKRYKQYRSMLKKGDSWTKKELMDFAMWHTLPTDEFASYASLKGYDQTEWLRKYWKKLDPTPITEVNETLEEFERRINYVRAHFADFWEYRHFRYLKDEWLKHEWEHAPWDARGEIYLKYGEPDFRSINDFHKEEWTYWRYNVDFIISQYMTNIYGNAISPGPMSKYIHEDISPNYVEFNFIYNPEFRYHHDYKSSPIKKFKLTIDNNFKSEKGNIRISYMTETDEFKIIPASTQFLIKYLQTYVIFDSDMRELGKDEKTVEIIKDSKKSFKKDQEIKQEVVLRLKPGEYMFALQIQDLKSDKLGIYLENFVVKE